MDSFLIASVVVVTIVACVLLYQAWRKSTHKFSYLLAWFGCTVTGFYLWIKAQGPEFGSVYAVLSVLLCTWGIVLIVNRHGGITSKTSIKMKEQSTLNCLPSLSWLVEASRLCVMILIACAASLSLTLCIMPRIPLSEASQLVVAAFMLPSMWAVFITLAFIVPNLWLSAFLLLSLTGIFSIGVWTAL